ncbi:MAG TPA: translation initiation factor IF-2 [Candidatus Eisenbacteria bacterium]|nr:translation initiation factor IF-2 [Candidatus Eisenbacteria bacterium]
MNISELARRLRANPDELREKLPQLGFDVGRKAIKVDDRLVNKIMEKWSEMRKTDRLKMKYQKEERIVTEAVAQVKKVELPNVITVRDFAAKLSLPLNIVISELMKNGILASINERVDFDTASIVAEDLGYEVGKEEEKDHVAEGGMSTDELKTMLGQEDPANLKARPPVVVVMGHVDHGKTSLLDKIREAKVARGEAGGITQHIGAYQAERNERRITFIDTPGHEAFTVMRSRGARVADVAILVVAADDGVQPQTIEVIKIIQAAKIPFVVALNKMDKPGVDLQRVKTQLAEQGVNPEEWGGTVTFVPVSAKTGAGIDQLLDMILLVADIDPERIKANPDRLAAGTIIESHVDKGEGPVATVLVQSGTLRRNDELAIGGSLYGRVRAMKDWNGKLVEKATPGTPMKVIGFKIAPQVGDIVQVPEDGRLLNKLKKQYTVEKHSAPAIATGADEEKKEGKKFLNIVLKVDALGSLEAIAGQLEKMKSDEVGVAVVGRGLGNVTDGDITRAEASGGVVMAFNVLSTREAEILARDKKVEIHKYKIIYELFDEVKKRLQSLVPAEIIRTDLGKLEVLAIFRVDKTGQVIGGRVTDGHLETGANAVLYRGGEPNDEGKILQLQTGKQDTKEVRMGQECGMKVSFKRPALVGDVVDVFKEERREKKLVFTV